MHKLRTAIAGILTLLAVATAYAQTFPSVPSQSVIGRLGVVGTTGPSQAIPIATLRAQLGLPLNVVTFGADPTGVSDSYAALMAAWASCPARGCAVYFPRGKYKFLTSPIYTFSTTPAGMHVFGDSPDATILEFPTTYGLQFSFAGPENSVTVNDITLQTDQAGGQIGLSLLQPTNAKCLGSYTSSYITNVIFRGDDAGGGFGTVDHWEYALFVEGVSGTNFTNSTVWGGGTGGIGAVYAGRWVSSADHCFSVQHNLVNVSAENVLDGVQVGTAVQGIQISNSNFISINDGVNVLPAGVGIGEVSLQGSQVTALSNCVEVNANTQSLAVQNNPFLACTTTGVATGNVLVTGVISGNSIIPNTLHSGIGVLIQGGSSFGNTGLHISENVISDFATAISLTGTSSLVQVGLNTLNGNTASITNIGTNNIIPTGTGSLVLATSPVLVTPNLGTPSAVTLTNGTGLPIAGLAGLGTGVGTWLATPSSANLRSALTDETGTGAAYFQNGDLGTPSAGVATNLSGTASGLTAGHVTTNANLTGDVTSVGNATTIANNAVTLAKLATQATNTVLGNATSGSAVPTALTVGSCSTSGSAIIWTTNTGFGCNTAIVASSSTTATTATNATNTAVTDDTTTNATVYPTWVTTTTGNLPQKLSSTKLTFNPSTGALSPTSLSTTNGVALTNLAQSGANTMLGNWTGSTANVSANSMPSCSDTTGNHLNYVSGTGVTCGTSVATPTAATRQVLKSGSAATYTRPTAPTPIQLRITMCGGGGGGGGSGTSGTAGNGTDGTDSTFSTFTANHGVGTNTTGLGAGAGGTAVATTATVWGLAGAPGGGAQTGVAGTAFGGTPGGSSPFFAGITQNATGATANTGAGGTGGGVAGAANTGGGGGGAACLQGLINSPSSTYTYTVGAAGSGGSAGTSGAVGQAGATGIIIVDEVYQ